MGRIGIAFSAFFASLFNAQTAARVRQALRGEAVPGPAPSDQAASKPKPGTSPPAARPPRSDALSLLAAMQREGRLVDFLMEDVSSFSDEQIGAASREVHRGCRQVLQRMFAPQPASELSEGADIEIPPGYDGQRFQLVGRVTGEPPYRGRLTHHGWLATQEILPQWQGTSEAAKLIAPVEVEL